MKIHLKVKIAILLVTFTLFLGGYSCIAQTNEGKKCIETMRKARKGILDYNKTNKPKTMWFLRDICGKDACLYKQGFLKQALEAPTSKCRYIVAIDKKNPKKIKAFGCIKHGPLLSEKLIRQMQMMRNVNFRPKESKLMRFFKKNSYFIIVGLLLLSSTIKQFSKKE